MTKINSFLKPQILIIFLLIVTLIKELVFAALVPIWQTPDEQAHFAQVAYFAENGRMPFQSFDLSNEILVSEKLLKTERDEKGNNSYTYHPEFNIDYSDNLIGKREDEIKNIPASQRTQYTKYEAANYPPLYYWLAAIGYRLNYNSDLISRVYASRFISIILLVALVWISYLIARQLFPDNEILQVTLPTLISFQPMLSFVSAGVTSDTLMNLLFGLFLYFTILLVKYGLDKKIITLSILTIILIYFTKPQFIIALPILLVSLVMGFFLHQKVKPIFRWLILVVTFLIMAVILIFSTNQGLYTFIQKFYPQSFFPGSPKHLAEPISFVKLTINRTLHETIPWYFGVFKWLGLVLPIEAIRIINRVLIVVGFGVLVKLISMIRKRTINDWLFVFLLLVSIIYFAVITIYDYIMYSTVNFSFGIQGRYFFPVIIAHFAIILIALTGLVPKKWQNWRGMVGLILSLLMILLNFVALNVIAKSYYYTTNFNSFIIQASQYKPDYFKGGMLEFWFISYGLILFFFILGLILKCARLNFSKFALKSQEKDFK